MRETCIHDSHFLLDLQKLLLLGIIEVTCFLLFLKLLLVLFPEENNSRRLKRRRWRKLPDGPCVAEKTWRLQSLNQRIERKKLINKLTNNTRGTELSHHPPSYFRYYPMLGGQLLGGGQKIWQKKYLKKGPLDFKVLLGDLTGIKALYPQDKHSQKRLHQIRPSSNTRQIAQLPCSTHPRLMSTPTLCLCHQSRSSSYFKHWAMSPLKPKHQVKILQSPKQTKVMSPREPSWSLFYLKPCVVDGMIIPNEIVKNIVNSIPQSRIHRDIRKQILLRWMRGRPNPQPGPRLSSVYTVCLVCASWIRYGCSHVKGRKDPNGAKLVAIPTPLPGSEGEMGVRLVLQIPQSKSSSISWLPCPSYTEQRPQGPTEDYDTVITPEGEKSQEALVLTEATTTTTTIQAPTFSIQSMSPAIQHQSINHQFQGVKWLLYIKTMTGPLPQYPPSSPSSSSSSPFSPSSSFSDCVSFESFFYHRLPPGVYWLDFIYNKDHQARERRISERHQPSGGKIPTNSTTKKLPREKAPTGSGTFLKAVLEKFQNNIFKLN
ncbi:casein kinase II subunit alpha'-interacting protein isoform X1 [Monodelphis domestica]|uniref:casein kinase II subunit alpha'-interacting protein isoform X1 n=1 Tax=Monodelphis domestica TaxID=13616 RepID=UPI00044331C5|nr:casein kinase II subunit alpha'-interacting protein isoform X1 [Monodelphis domestica]